MTLQFRTSIASRERNRIHARKTRLRKKEQMQTLQSKVDDLKEEQIRLKQVINEKNTASILVDLFSTSGETREVNALSNEDPMIEELLRRPTSDIPDSTNIAELPSLILPGQHASKKMKASSCAPDQVSMAGDGIDYDLLGKDRAKCTPEELDKIRRERNRMHAKRTRDRKRMFMEELAEICRKLEEENDILRSHLLKIDPDYEDEIYESEKEPLAQPEVISESEPTLVPNSLVPLAPKFDPEQVSSNPSVNPTKMTKQSGGMIDQIQTLLAAATCFDRQTDHMLSYAFVSSDESNDERAFDDPSLCPAKRRRLNSCSIRQPSPMASC
jgi:Basic region leucine zipper